MSPSIWVATSMSAWLVNNLSGQPVFVIRFQLIIFCWSTQQLTRFFVMPLTGFAVPCFVLDGFDFSITANRLSSNDNFLINEKNLWRCLDLNPGLLDEKPWRYLCAMSPPNNWLVVKLTRMVRTLFLWSCHSVASLQVFWTFPKMSALSSHEDGWLMSSSQAIVFIHKNWFDSRSSN